MNKRMLLVLLALVAVLALPRFFRPAPPLLPTPAALRLEADYQFWIRHHPRSKREAAERARVFLAHDRATVISDLADERAKERGWTLAR